MMEHNHDIEPPLPLVLLDGIANSSPDNGISSNGVIEIIPPGKFDYSSYDAADEVEIRQAADRIRSSGRELNAAAAEIGTALRAVKEKVGHGNWGRWLAAEFNMSVSTAERCMVVVDRFGTKFVTMTNLQPTTQYLLAAKSTPRDVADQIVAELEAGNNLSNEAIRDRIARAKEEAKRAAQEAKLTPQQRKRRARKRAEAEAHHEQRVRECEERIARETEASETVAVILVTRLGDQLGEVVRLLDNADLQRIRSALQDEQCRLAEQGTSAVMASISPSGAAPCTGDATDLHENEPGEADEPPPTSSADVAVESGTVVADPDATEDALDAEFAALSPEQRAIDRDYLMRGHACGETAPINPSPFLRLYLDAPEAEQKAFRARLVADPIRQAA